MGSGEDSPRLQTAALPSSLHTVKREQENSLGTNLLHEGSPSWCHQLPKGPPSNTTTVGVRISTYEFGHDANIQCLGGLLKVAGV